MIMFVLAAKMATSKDKQHSFPGDKEMVKPLSGLFVFF